MTLLGYKQAIFPYEQPALFAMPLAFLAAWLVSVLDKSPRAAKDREAFDDQDVCAETGFRGQLAPAH